VRGRGFACCSGFICGQYYYKQTFPRLCSAAVLVEISTRLFGRRRHQLSGPDILEAIGRHPRSEEVGALASFDVLRAQFKLKLKPGFTCCHSLGDRHRATSIFIKPMLMRQAIELLACRGLPSSGASRVESVAVRV
jgi:hypothetical protein